ncbi:hypothetical protein K439DRAFT_1344360 [Ramaria rubella]|nr:hypothetical protein K439DRAFT_1344360 [Ramaria rubella]
MGKSKHNRKGKTKCGNCDHTGHTTDKCWVKGGKGASSAPDWWKKKQKPEKANAADTESGSESAAIAVGTPPNTINNLFVDRLYNSYLSCMALEGATQENVSTVWIKLQVDGDATPFFLDTGATSHCSPIKSDFIDLEPIEPRSVRGVNGVSIPAIG